MKTKFLLSYAARPALLCLFTVLFAHAKFLKQEKETAGDNNYINFYADYDGDGYGNPSDFLKAAQPPKGYVANNKDCDDNNPNIHPGAKEICDGKDNDCDGNIDEHCNDEALGRKKCPCENPQIYFADSDGDGYGDADNFLVSCDEEPPEGYVDNSDDCDDDNEAINPEAAEFCDGEDNDCDGLVDGEDPDVFYKYLYFKDSDGDGYGDDEDVLLSCDDTAPEGYAEIGGDCDDENYAINPGAEEVCDGIDNNCNGLVDGEDPEIQWELEDVYFADADGDGYGTPFNSIFACEPPDGYVANSDDCDDNDPDVNPFALEICDGKDNDCDDLLDADDPDIVYTEDDIYYLDYDLDGYGDSTFYYYFCNPPYWFVKDNTDCDDNDPDIHPDAVEVCDGKDNDCNGLMDDDDPGTVYTSNDIFYRDADGDGFGNPNNFKYFCKPQDGYVKDNTDCADNDPKVYPGAPPPLLVIHSRSNFICTDTALFYATGNFHGVTATGWQVSTGLTIIAGQNTPGILVVFDKTALSDSVPDTIIFRYIFCNATIAAATTTVNPHVPPPATPIIIRGPKKVVPGSQDTFSVKRDSTICTYLWSITPGASIISGQGTRKVTVQFDAGFSNGTISVAAKNSLGTSLPQTLNLTSVSSVNIAKAETSLMKEKLEHSLSGELSLYPNPSTGNITVTYFGITSGKAELKVYDVTGKAVFTQTEQAIKGNNTYQLNLSHLNAGMYYLEIHNGLLPKRIKFIISR